MDLLTSDQQAMIATMATDAITCYHRIKSEPQQEGLWKRAMIKSVFAFHEGLCSILRDMARNRYQNNMWKLKEGELDVLDDTEFELEVTGKVKERSRKDKTLHLIAFTVRLILKGFGVSDEEIAAKVFGVQGWNGLCTSMKLRDRLSHPKTVDALCVTDEEIEQYRSTMRWMYGCIDLASAASLRQVGFPEDQIPEASKRILAALPDVRF